MIFPKEGDQEAGDWPRAASVTVEVGLACFNCGVRVGRRGHIPPPRLIETLCRDCSF
jgi:hypothetical protein